VKGRGATSGSTQTISALNALQAGAIIGCGERARKLSMACRAKPGSPEARFWLRCAFIANT